MLVIRTMIECSSRGGPLLLFAFVSVPSVQVILSARLGFASGHRISHAQQCFWVFTPPVIRCSRILLYVSVYAFAIFRKGVIPASENTTVRITRIAILLFIERNVLKPSFVMCLDNIIDPYRLIDLITSVYRWCTLLSGPPMLDSRQPKRAAISFHRMY